MFRQNIVHELYICGISAHVRNLQYIHIHHKNDQLSFVVRHEDSILWHFKDSFKVKFCSQDLYWIHVLCVFMLWFNVDLEIRFFFNWKHEKKHVECKSCEEIFTLNKFLKCEGGWSRGLWRVPSWNWTWWGVGAPQFLFQHHQGHMWVALDCQMIIGRHRKGCRIGHDRNCGIQVNG